MVTKTKAKKAAEKSKPSGKYYEAVGRRKTSSARVRIWPEGKGSFVVNDKNADKYFVTQELQKIIGEPFSKTKTKARFNTSVHVSGGGIHSQAEAVRHGLSRALVEFNDEFHDRLKKAGLLKRDPRMKERKKFGLKKARRAAQWSKR